MSDIFDLKLINRYLETAPSETPFFLFSKKRILEKFHEFKLYFPASLVQYAMKANAEPEALKTLNDVGCGFEVASVYELRMLKELKVAPDKIIYGSSVKPVTHIKEFFEYGVDRFAFDSSAELEKIAGVAHGSRVYVRISVDDTGSVFKFSEKFGTEVENVVPLLSRAKALGLEPYGISFHVGSQASNPEAWSHALKSLEPIMKELMKNEIKIEVLNIGGGYPCQYASTGESLSVKDIAKSVYAQCKNLPYQPTLMLEPGRGIIADAGILVSNVIARVERKGNTWLFLDAGVYSGLFETMAYQGSTRYKVTSVRHSFSSGEKMFALAGPTGDSPDIISREALLPQDINVGDALIFHSVGAYSLVAVSSFNGFPKPAVHFV